VRRTGKGCLSYLVGGEGEAAVVDASLDPEIYIRLADERGWRITQVIDTHIHADHLSRSRALAAHAGATLRLPRQDRATFPHTPLDDGDTITIGPSTLAALATPGHTMESMSYLLDGAALLTGDTLFLAAVGRPDLEAGEGEARARARALYRSLTALAAFPGETLVLPGHTSEPIPFDGEPIVAPLAEVVARIDTLRRPEAAFADLVLARIPPTPPNHAVIVARNGTGELPGGDLTDLEAGANRCAIA
jgi:glyoxylase-like metal-dependent hydrolase (beta-lactamase superfamily II)